MRVKKLSLALACIVSSLVIVGCAAPATGLRSGEKDIKQYLMERPEVPAGKARVVVYTYQGFGSGWNHKSGFMNIEINSKRVFSNLGNTRYDSAIVDAGPSRVTAGGEGDLGDCVQNYFFPPGETTFIKVSMRESQRAAQAIFGLLGALIESAAAKKQSECGGGWKTELVSSDAAVSEINDLGR